MGYPRVIVGASNPECEDIGMWLDRLSAFKKNSKKTIKQISEESNVPVGTLNKLFAGQTKDPKLGTVRAVVHSLGYTLDDLFADIQEKENPAPSSDDAGRKVTTEEVEAMLIDKGFIRPGEDLSDADLRFLISVGEMISAWFADR